MMMTARKGQVAVYLVLVLIAITFLVMMNVGAFLGVSARNTTMNAGDAAALAVAHYQGELLNRIGKWNVEHLQAAIDGDAEQCEEIVVQQARCCFLDPLEGIRIGNEAAKKNDSDRNDKMRDILKRHVTDIRTYYAPNPDVYPEPWKGAWEEYAQRLELAIGEGIWAGPDNIDFVDAATGHYLLDREFYQAIAGRNWCWFHFNARDLLDTYSSYRDWGPLPSADDETRRRRCCNSEVYSLGLNRRVGSAIDLIGTNIIMRLTGASEDKIRNAPLLRDRNQSWFFYDTSEPWRTWWELDPEGEWAFPAMGHVKPEYNVRGCAAICRVTRAFANVVQDDVERESVWSGAAKPFGTVADEKGELSDVTGLRGLVTEDFADTRLVPLDSVGGRDLSTADPEWMEHVRGHLRYYLQHGPGHFPGCWYCQQLVDWENKSLRAIAREWLKYYSSTCIRPHGSGGGHGGSAHGH